MRRLKGKHLVTRGMALVIVLAAGTSLLEYLLHANTATVKWTFLIALIIFLGLFGLALLEVPKHELVNRWYRAAYRVLWIFCGLIGGLLISAVLLWALTEPTLDHFPEVSDALVFSAWMILIVGGLVIGGLTLAGYFEKEIRESNERSRAWGYPPWATRARSTEETAPPE
jgi:FtsH-binding integral membrane protein